MCWRLKIYSLAYSRDTPTELDRLLWKVQMADDSSCRRSRRWWSWQFQWSFPPSMDEKIDYFCMQSMTVYLPLPIYHICCWGCDQRMHHPTAYMYMVDGQREIHSHRLHTEVIDLFIEWVRERPLKLSLSSLIIIIIIINISWREPDNDYR